MPTQIILGCRPVSSGDWLRNASSLINELLPFIWGIKVGSETRDEIDRGERRMTLNNRFSYHCHAHKMRIMLDYKICETGAAAGSILAGLPLTAVEMLTVSYDVSDAAMWSIIETCHQHGTKVLVVTVKTDITNEECKRRFGRSIAGEAFHRTQWAKHIGADGVVLPPAALKDFPDISLRGIFTNTFESVTPAIRWDGQNPSGHVNPMTPEEIAPYKPHYVVADSAIWNAPDMTPIEAAQNMFEIFNRA